MTQPAPDVALLVCRPVVITDDYPPGVPVPDPYPDSVEQPCEVCGVAVWVGPALFAKKKEMGAKALIVCYRDGALISRGHEVTIQSLTDKVTPLRMPMPGREN